MLTVYVAGFPKSGLTWMTRLLGSAYACPTGGWRSDKDSEEIATELIEDRPNKDMLIRKGHYIPTFDFNEPAVNSVMRLNIPTVEEAEDKIIIMVRDPRDITVSATYYWNSTFEDMYKDLIQGKGHFRALGSWSDYYSNWLDADTSNKTFIKYEDFLLDPKKELGFIEGFLFTPMHKDLELVIQENSIVNMRNKIMLNPTKFNLGSEFNLRFLRKGISGEHTKVLPKKYSARVKVMSKFIMSKFGYD